MIRNFPPTRQGELPILAGLYEQRSLLSDPLYFLVAILTINAEALD